MGDIQDKIGEQPQPNGGGMRRVLDDGSASLGELREFMSNLRGKSPQEVLGEVANSSLVQSTIVSAIGFLVVIVGLSVTTHYWKQAFAGEEKATTAQSATEEPSSTPNQVSDTNSPAADTNSSTADTADVTKSGDPMLDNLGIGDAKSADPKKNPLENSLDNLLDGAK